MHNTRLLIFLVSAVALAGCASSKSGDVYTRDQTRVVQTVMMGVVESVRQVQIEGTKTPVGTATGAVVGGVAGSTIGGGRGQTIATVLGAVAGGLAGSAAEEGITRKDGVEITVMLDSGTMISVVQEATELFNPGERVRVLEGGGVTRVTH
jgi:outer membrane lipoprotein SlyB